VVTSQKVETLRKPSTGLKHTQRLLVVGSAAVETLRKPSTGLKHSVDVVFYDASDDVETLRKPSTGLKLHAGEDVMWSPEVSRHSENPARD